MDLRKKFVMEAMKEGASMSALCAEHGISRKTGYKWLERFKASGSAGLEDDSRRPRAHARGLPEEVVCEILRLKALKPAWGPKKIRAIYARTHADVPSESSFKRVLDRAGWVKRRRLRKRQSAGRLAAGRKAEAPNDVWTIDFKGSWHGVDGSRCEPLTVRDEYSRFVLEVRALPNARSETVQACFENLFKEHGLPQVIRSDNGSPFASSAGLWGLTRLSAWWIGLGIDLERSRPGCPQDNPAHERFHLDIAREIESLGSPTHQAFMDQWRHEYNHQRPHEALAMRTPAELYSKSQRPYKPAQDLDYGMMQRRKVSPKGIIAWQNGSIFISNALAGWSVGLEPCAEGKYHVWFGRLLLGTLDPSACHFTPLAQKEP